MGKARAGCRARYRVVIAGAAAVVIFYVCALWVVAGALIRPSPSLVEPLPRDLSVTPVHLTNQRGGDVFGWYARATTAKGVIVLLHGLRGDRRSMVARMDFLVDAGYDALAIDFQAHGQTQGRDITFGFLEAHDVTAAVRFARAQRRRDGATLPVFAIGVSLGGAAALLAEPVIEVDGLILEGVYTTIEAALRNRLALRLGPARYLVAAPLQTILEHRLRLSATALRPIERATRFAGPVLVMGGDRDRRTTVRETNALFDAFAKEAAGLSELWVVPGAAHVDLHTHATADYEQRVLRFLDRVISTIGRGDESTRK
ncbi:MAG: alpha/beta fold hydrolase [Gammaproteobacteria bacterium]|nr:alpha/beta fold hydrolase [Gammaproteobacteria bacterium]